MGKLGFTHLILGGIDRRASAPSTSVQVSSLLLEAPPPGGSSIVAPPCSGCADGPDRRGQGSILPEGGGLVQEGGGERLHPPHSVNLKGVKLSIGESYGLHPL